MKVVRRPHFTFSLFFLIAASVGYISGQQPIKDLRRTVILISIDGFRADYFEMYQPPTINKLASEGVRAKWMTPAFPTKTFPNHYTVATGLYPAHHGIVENNVWDFGVTFTMSTREEVQNPRWWLGEPIWVTAEKQGQRAAAMFFPGTEAKIGGVYATFWKPYEHTYPNEKRVDTVLEWLDLPADKRPTLYTMYFSDVDSAGHESGPYSEGTRNAVLKVDAAIERLADGLKKRRIYDKVNLIIFSDHGMAPVDQRNAMIMDDYLDESRIEKKLTTGEIWQIFPKVGEDSAVISKLRNLHHATCWLKNEIPERLHYSDGARVAPIVCSSAEGWFMTMRNRYDEQKKRSDFGDMKGAHGYDNQLTSMRAIFLAHGRAFKKHKLAQPILNVDVYELMCKILRLKPAKNDGDLRRIREILK
ncbi:MAG: ectonucleotide pyrophosphatase/phosphodiesterase [Pyrinomonadaceae bacterium]